MQRYRKMDQLLERFPNNVEILTYHLSLAFIRGDADRATKLLAQAPPSSSEDSRFWRMKAWVHERRDEPAKAELAYLHAVKLHPFDWQTQHNLAAIYRRRQDFDRVKQFQAQATLGRDIMRDTLLLPDSQSMTDQLLKKMRRYAKITGAEEVAERLEARNNSPQQTTANP